MLSVIVIISIIIVL